MKPGCCPQVYIRQTQVFTRNQAVYHTGIYQPADFMESSYSTNHLLIYKIQAGLPF